MTASYSGRALAIHQSLPVVDGHNDLPWKLRTTPGVHDPGGHLEGFHTDIPRLLNGGVGAQLWSVYVPADIANPFQTTMEQIDLVEDMVDSHDELAIARDGNEARQIRDSGRIASLLGAEGGHSIENSLDNLHTLAERGVRYMTLTHSDANEWADSATDDPVHGGLSSFGKEVVREMNRLDVLVDISHVSVATMRDSLDVSEAPVIASHSNAHAIAPHPRNIPDEILREVGARDGVVMVNFFSGFVLAETATRVADMFETLREIRTRLEGDETAITAEFERLEQETDLTQGSVADVVDHIEYIADLAGVASVGLGSDFDGTFLTPNGLEDVSCYPAITDELLKRGWAEEDILKLLGGNTLRVLSIGSVGTAGD